MSEAALPQRKLLRLRGYDYAAPNWFFVTICIADRRPILGNVVGSDVELTAVGRIVSGIWSRLPEFYPAVALGNFIVMPNHVHGIIVIGEACTARGLKPRKHALPEIVRGLKSMSARAINRTQGNNRLLWQRGYYEHVIRDDADLARIREYIDDNPIAWANDPENPDRAS